MKPNPNADPINIAELLQSISSAQSNQAIDENPIDVDAAVGGILRKVAHGAIPAKAADAIPGLEIFEDSDNPGSWFWEWEWGECQDGPHGNELEALVAFAKFSSELAIELSNDEAEEEE